MGYLIFVLCLFFVNDIHADTHTMTRPPYVAGTFYSNDVDQLNAQIADALQSSKNRDTTQEPSVLIVPHAGYIYSAKTAGYAYQFLKHHQFDTIIVMGPKHSKPIQHIAVYGPGMWTTPLGSVAIDEDVVNTLTRADPNMRIDFDVHKEEHAIEVQLPFIQTLQPHAKIVPIAINNDALAPDLARALKHVIDTSPKKILLIASTDMSHYKNEDETHKRDYITQKAVHDLDTTALENALTSGQGEMCGGAAALTVLHYLKLLPNPAIKILDYSTSADSSHDTNRVVGYMSAMGWHDVALTQDQKETLHKIAQFSLNHLREDIPKNITMRDPILSQKHAVFITLRTSDKKLRGCIGRILPEEALWRAVYHMTQEAALSDSRFSPVSAKEIPHLSLEISVLSIPKSVASIDDIAYPDTGVIIRRESQSGVYLPEVSHEFSSKEDYLNSLCRDKAKLEKKCWINPNTHLSIFTTQHF